jgi:peptidoglycan/xylan/chitin deacetylase (PgdA/CDA1 family)
MLLIPLYHSIGEGKYSNTLEMFKKHLEYLLENFSIVAPGDELPQKHNAVCLSFDDAFADFYIHVFPLLKEYGIKALLAVPTKYILEKTLVPTEERLAVSYSSAMECYKEKAPYCTWEELKEMVDSGCVVIASHSHSHVDLTSRHADKAVEVCLSKQILEDKLGGKITSFVYPFGKVNHDIHSHVQEQYSYALRIGGAANTCWDTSSKLLYRFNADNLPSPEHPFKKAALCQYAAKGFFNRLLNR